MINIASNRDVMVVDDGADENDNMMTEDEKDTLIALQSKRIWQLEQKVKQLIKTSEHQQQHQQHQRHCEEKQSHSQEVSEELVLSPPPAQVGKEGRRRLLTRSGGGSGVDVGSCSSRSSVLLSKSSRRLLANAHNGNKNHQSTSCSRRESSDSDDGHRTVTATPGSNNGRENRMIPPAPPLSMSQSDINKIGVRNSGSGTFNDNFDEQNNQSFASLTSADVLSLSLEHHRREQQSSRSVVSFQDDSNHGLISMSGLTRTQELHAEIHSLNQRLEELNFENTEVTEDLQSLLQENDDMNGEIKTLEERLQKALDEVTNLTQERDGLAEEVERLRHREKKQEPDEMDELMKDMERQLRRKDRKIQQQQKELEKAVSEVQNEKSDLIDEIYEAMKKKATSERDLEKYQEQFKIIKKELRQLWQNERAVSEAAKVSARTAEHSHIKAALPASNLVVQKTQQQIQALRKLLFDLESMEMNMLQGSEENSVDIDFPSTMSLPLHHRSSSISKPTPIQKRISDCVSAFSGESLNRLDLTEPSDYKNGNNNSNRADSNGDGDDDDDCSITLGSVTSGVGSLVTKTRTSIVHSAQASSRTLMKSVAKGGQWFLHDTEKPTRAQSYSGSKDFLFYSEPRGHAHHYMEEEEEEEEEHYGGRNRKENENNHNEKDDLDFSLHSMFSRASHNVSFNLDALYENKSGEDDEEEPSENEINYKPGNEKDQTEEGTLSKLENDLDSQLETSAKNNDGDNSILKQSKKDDILSCADERELAEIEGRTHPEVKTNDVSSSLSKPLHPQQQQKNHPSNIRRKKSNGGRQSVRELLEQTGTANEATNGKVSAIPTSVPEKKISPAQMIYSRFRSQRKSNAAALLSNRTYH